jgi:hypothetical protein
MSSSEIRAQLIEVARERLQDECVGTDADVLAALTELAVLHGQLYGRKLG